MKNSKHSDSRFVAILKEAEADQSVIPTRSSMSPTRCAVWSLLTKI